MAFITGKDFAFEVPDIDLVRIAMCELRDAGEKITLQSVADLSGLNVQDVRAILLEMKAEHERSER